MRKLRIGIIGLSVHSGAFTEIINSKNENPVFTRCEVTVLYEPPVNKDVAFSEKQIKDFTTSIKSHGVRFVDSMEALLAKSDAVMILTNDGRPHFEEMIPVFKAGKPVFIDKPLAENFSGVKAIFDASEKYHVPVFTSSALRYSDTVQSVAKDGGAGDVTGADTYGPAPVQNSHVDLFWDGVHGVELLYTVMGCGCRSVMRINKEGEDVVIGIWNRGRVGIFRGLRKGKKGFGGRAFGTEGIIPLDFHGYTPLVEKIVQFFRTGISPVMNKETVEIYAFMEAANWSKEANGRRINMADILDQG